MTSRATPNPSRESGSVLAVVLIATIALVATTAALMTMAQTNTRASRQSTDAIRCAYAADGALDVALSEIMALDDWTGDGIGAVGIATPRQILDSDGNPVAEYRTIVTQSDADIEVLAVAAVPNFASADFVSAARGFVRATPTSILAPLPGALDIAGPIVDPDLRNVGNNSLLIDGGKNAAMTFTDSDAFDLVVDRIGDRLAAGDLDGSELQGDELSELWHDLMGDLDLPLGLVEQPFLSTETLDDYRSAIRSAVLSLADSADRVITSSVMGNQTWGTAGSPEVTVIDADAIGPRHVFLTDGQTIQGNGTLIIKHWITPEMNLNLDWDGDIFVIGYDEDEDDLFKHRGTQGTIDGKLILLASEGTEASIELLDSSSRPSQLEINGSLLCLAEEGCEEAELEVEDNSSLTVNGLVGLYGSRIEIEAAHKTSSLTINGTLAIGVAQDLAEEMFRSDDFEFDMNGQVVIRYFEDYVGDAIAALTDLETAFGANAETGSSPYTMTEVGGYSGSISGPDALATMQQVLDSGERTWLSIDDLPTTVTPDP